MINVAIVRFHSASMATDIWSKNTKLGVIHTLFESDNSNVAILYLIRFEISKGIHRTLRNPSLFTVFYYSEYVIKRWEAQCCDKKKMVHSSLAHSSLVKKKGGATRKLASFSFSAQPLYRHFPFSPSHIPFSNVYFFFFFIYKLWAHMELFRFHKRYLERNAFAKSAFQNDNVMRLTYASLPCQACYCNFRSYTTLSALQPYVTRIFVEQTSSSTS